MPSRSALRTLLRLSATQPLALRGSGLTVSRLVCVCVLVVGTGYASCSNEPKSQAFEGRWDLIITEPHASIPSWIEISTRRGHTCILMVGIADHPNVLRTTAIHGRDIRFVSPKGEEGFPHDMQFEGTLVDGELRGTVSGTPGEVWQWTGLRAPTLARKESPEWGTPKALFNNLNLAGWSLLNPTKGGNWDVKKGFLIKTGSGSELVSNERFGDFKLHLEFNCGPFSNSGVYLRGRYEVQIETDSESKPQDRRTGAIYGFLAPKHERPSQVNVWQTLDITLIGRNVTIMQNGDTIIDHRDIPGITGGAMDSLEGLDGPIYLQGSEEGRVMFRNIVLTPATTSEHSKN